MFAIAVSLALTVSPAAAAVSAAPASPADPQAGHTVRVLVVRNLHDRGKGS